MGAITLYYQMNLLMSLYLCLSLFQLNINVNLQIAATFCISNLVWNEEEGKRSLLTHFPPIITFIVCSLTYLCSWVAYIPNKIKFLEHQP